MQPSRPDFGWRLHGRHVGVLSDRTCRLAPADRDVDAVLAPYRANLTTLQAWNGGWEETSKNSKVWRRSVSADTASRCFFDGVGQGRAEDEAALADTAAWYFDVASSTLYVYSRSDDLAPVLRAHLYRPGSLTRRDSGSIEARTGNSPTTSPSTW